MEWMFALAKFIDTQPYTCESTRYFFSALCKTLHVINSTLKSNLRIHLFRRRTQNPMTWVLKARRVRWAKGTLISVDAFCIIYAFEHFLENLLWRFLRWCKWENCYELHCEIISSKALRLILLLRLAADFSRIFSLMEWL